MKSLEFTPTGVATSRKCSFSLSRYRLSDKIAAFSLAGMLCLSACKDDASSGASLRAIVISPSSAILVPGDTVQLTANPVPFDAEHGLFTWSASRTNIATVTDNGLVTAVEEGSTFVKTRSGDIEGSAMIVVTSLIINIAPAILDDLRVGDSAQLVATSTPPNAGMAEKPFLWSTDNPAVATVSDDGWVKGVSSGSAQITARGRVRSEVSKSIPVTVSNDYQNPVTTQSLPDPTVIRAGDGWFYLYATEDTRNVPILRSRNLMIWEQVGTCFDDDGRPAWGDGGAGIWAPDINYINGQYVLFYSLSVWGGETTCGIGVATADSPAGPFTDQGKLFISSEIGVDNSIDPFYIEDEGKKYLIWGSFRGIYAIELQEDGLAVKQDAVKEQIAGTAFEAAYVHRRGNYYYLFASWGSCCDGASSTYKVVVGRSSSLLGPYVSKDGNRMLEDNAYENVIQGNDLFAGPGHNAEIVTDATGNDWLLYHAYVKATPTGRQLMLDKINWSDDGWPSISDNAPSSQGEGPLF
jgi:arabinan endo-1,5-alpha-L-arabinosidase